MPCIDIVRESAVIRTARVMQVEGIFDVPPSQRSGERWSVDLALPDDWSIGVIVGPSGSGKTTIAREMFGSHLVGGWDWPADKSILDGFPTEMSIKEITALLSSVGFSSPPSWVRPFHVLSNGEQFRVTMARTLAEMRDLAVVDEFTSVVDRTVAQIGSAAIAKTVRRREQRLIAVTCHYDVLEWLEPDWVYEPATGVLSVGRLLQRPTIELEIARVHSSAWEMFRKHHYLDTKLQSNARCFVASWQGAPVAFAGVSVFPHPSAKNIMREHRLVCLPDFQGVGIGNALSMWMGGACRALGLRYRSISSNPAVNASRGRSSAWRCEDIARIGTTLASRSGTLTGKRWRNSSMNTRFMQTFEYVGPALPVDEARRVWEGR
jgi:ABC-type thiamine transport system ATPase subunit